MLPRCGRAHPHGHLPRKRAAHRGGQPFNLFKGIEAVGHKNAVYIPSADGIVSYLLRRPVRAT